MRYIKKANDSASKSSAIFIDLEGLDLSIDDKSLLDSLCTFRTSTFQSLTTTRTTESGQAAWVVLFEPANKFFETLSDEDNREIALTMLAANSRIIELGGYLDNAHTTTVAERHQLDLYLRKVEDELDSLVYNLDKQIDLYNKIYDFVIPNIPRVYLQNAGERAQDSDEMTFYPAEIDQFTCISVLCKVLSPIIGAFIDSCNSSQFENKFMREIRCSCILKSIIHAHPQTQKLYAKLENYVACTLRVDKKEVEFTQVYNGYTPLVAVQYTLAALLVKKFVTVDLYTLNRGIAAYICTCIRGTGESPITSQRKSNSVRKMLVPSDKEYDDNQSNSSVLEVESIVSTQTADYKAVVGLAVDVAKTRFCAMYDFNPDMVDAIASTYRLNQVRLHPLNTYLLGLIFGDYIGGAKSVEMLTPENINILTAMAQLWLCQHGFLEIAVLMSATRTANRCQNSGETMALKASWDKSPNYTNCDNILVYRSNSLSWASALKNIVEDITTYQYVRNLAPDVVHMINDKLREENPDAPMVNAANGTPIMIVESIPQDICSITRIWIGD